MKYRLGTHKTMYHTYGDAKKIWAEYQKVKDDKSACIYSVADFAIYPTEYTLPQDVLQQNRYLQQFWNELYVSDQIKE